MSENLISQQPGESYAAQPLRRGALIPKIFGIAGVLLLVVLVATGIYDRLPHSVSPTPKNYVTFKHVAGNYMLCYDPALFVRKTTGTTKGTELFVSKDGRADFAVVVQKGSQGDLEYAHDLEALDATPGLVITDKYIDFHYDHQFRLGASTHGLQLVEWGFIMDDHVVRLKGQYMVEANSPDYKAAFDHIGTCFTSIKPFPRTGTTD